jgi:uncharacterized membrane protein
VVSTSWDEAAMRTDKYRERGSILPLGAVVMAAAVLMVLMVIELGTRAVDRAEAQTAADMAALAAVFEGRSGAVDLARRNGATLIGYRDDGRVVWVEVAIGEARARARAVFDPTAP